MHALLRLDLICSPLGVSIESVNWQGRFLVQHEAGDLSFHEGDGSDGYKAAATFCLKPGLANQGTGVSIEPLGESETYMLHDGYHMVHAFVRSQCHVDSAGTWES